MAKIWAQVLGVNVNDIGRRTSFFSIGGDSISAIRVVQLCKKAGWHILASELLLSNTLQQASSVMSSVKTQLEWPPIEVSECARSRIQRRWPGYESCFPATHEQHDMISTIDTTPSSFVSQVLFDLSQGLDDVPDKYRHLVAQRDILRSTFVKTEFGLFHVVQPSTMYISIPRISTLTLDAFLAVDLTRAFTLDDSSFARFAVVEHGNGQVHGVLTIHHALYDGATMAMLTADVLDALQGRPLAVRPPFRLVVDYIEAQDKLFHLEKSLTLLTKMRTFDVVIFGASGYTGEHIAVEWARVYGSTTRWALAGRSKKKLEATRAMILDKVRDVHDIPIVLADALDELALTAMCQSTTLVINCTGPFRLFGEPVVRCCVAAGTHYVDISGEPQFIETMMLRYNEDARKNACVVVSACGFDSVPSDLGTVFTAQQFPKGGACSSIEAFISTDGKRAHATTYECIVLGLAAADELKQLRGNVAPV
ncbi:hypothetical protein DYB34_013320 [Aphanomyces astaci]|uniref:Carrier domain-containing protein n=1 Tax=Aphanomyces astaci TaxID=112090 RepID=A0A418BXW3_APHAT|nr:hypothetical protein DYB34_013320 [Aphanomyces astaci]